MNREQVLDVLNKYVVNRSEAQSITGQSTPAFSQAVANGRLVPLKTFGEGRGSYSLFLKEEVEEYAKNKQKERKKLIITVEKKKKFNHIIGEEWTREYVRNQRLDFIDELDQEFVDEQDIEDIENKVVGTYYLDNGDFNYIVEISEGESRLGQLSRLYEAGYELQQKLGGVKKATYLVQELNKILLKNPKDFASQVTAVLVAHGLEVPQEIIKANDVSQLQSFLTGLLGEKMN